MTPLRINLEQEKIPTHWYNVVADMANPPAPPLGADGLPVPPEKMGAIFPGPILEQEMSAERWIAIPEEVRQIYALWRPAPLCRALRLEQALGTPAKIFYKYEGVSPAGSHKPNSAVPQAYYNKLAGTKIDYRNRCRAVGFLHRFRRSDVWPAGAGFHGQGQLRAEALPPLDDANLGRRGFCQPDQYDRSRSPRPGA